MTVGDGLFYSTLLVVFAAAIYFISTRHRWKLVGTIVGGLVLLGGVLGGGAWAWTQYQERPVVVAEYWGIHLGMTPTDVSLAKGKASSEHTGEEGRLAWIYTDQHDGTAVVFFDGADLDRSKVTTVCRSSDLVGLLGFGHLNTERDIVEKLGRPDRVSNSDDRLAKYISYDRWKVSYSLRKGSVGLVCLDGGERPATSADDRRD